VSHFCKTATAKLREPPPASAEEGAESAAKEPGPAGAATPSQVREFCAGLLELFEAALPTCLLYPQERPQYEALVAGLPRGGTAAQQNSPLRPTPLASVYGCEHLLRLLVRLPAMLRVEDPSRARRRWAGPLVADLIAMLQKNRAPIFSKSRYRPPKLAEYLDWERDLYDGGGG
jgi:hypothetical protein